MQLPTRYEAFWAIAVQAHPALERGRFLEAFAFGDSEALANELAALVLAGTKRATAALVWGNEHDGKPQPRPGDLSIVTTWQGEPLCLIETTAVEVVPFEDVSAEFARTEGEGDGSLAFWRREHAAYFARECERIGRTPDARMPVVCERFRVLYPPPAGDRPG
ncbi:ASCH domain-containing protein [Aquabacterium humicola]|uniref:ASCH domain-containing protein n=1 Tax=Aquabacterium humicola TaxID=3237377 RepID=UPI002543F2A4|nr:ASCH domain-containing protein [Rubrivivax pictus]